MSASPREAVAHRAAADLLDELAIGTHPIDPSHIAAEKGLPIEEQDGFPTDAFGALWRQGNRFGIVVSARCPTEGHRRFTIAHELGHYHIDGHVEQLFARGDGQHLSEGHFRSRRDPMEVEADAFAAALLMPERLARAEVRRLGPSLEAVRRLSAGFAVSLSCAAIRLAALADEAVAVVLARGGAIEWVARSPALWAQGGWARQTMKRERVPRGSGTRRLTESPTRLAAGADDGSELLACEWFDGAPPGLPAIEEALGLGSYGRVLTVLTFPQLPDPDAQYLDEQQRRDAAWHDAAGVELRERGDWRRGIRGYSLDDTE